MSGSSHLDRASNVEIDVEFQIFVIVNFFTCSWVLKFGAHSRYHRGALTQKRSFLAIHTTFGSAFHVSWNQNKHTTLNSSSHSLSKWHEEDIRCKKKNIIKLSYSAQKLKFWTSLFPYKLCGTGKRTYINKLKFRIFLRF